MAREKDHNVSVSGSHNKNVGNHLETTNNYNGLSREDLVAMLEERFRHMLEKEAQVKEIFEENRKLTDEVIRQNADFRIYNAAYSKQADRIAELVKRNDELTNNLLEKKL